MYLVTSLSLVSIVQLYAFTIRNKDLFNVSDELCRCHIIIQTFPNIISQNLIRKKNALT